MSDKPNCYACKHRRDLAGDCHSRCAHPAFDSLNADPGLNALAIFAGVRRVPPFGGKAEGCEVVGSPHGIARGWFNHPWNFDPTWLQSCTGFEAKSDAA